MAVRKARGLRVALAQPLGHVLIQHLVLVLRKTPVETNTHAAEDLAL